MAFQRFYHGQRLQRFYQWHQEYEHRHPHLSSWIGVAEGLLTGITIGIVVGYYLWF